MMKTIKHSNMPQGKHVSQIGLKLTGLTKNAYHTIHINGKFSFHTISYNSIRTEKCMKTL